MFSPLSNSFLEFNRTIRYFVGIIPKKETDAKYKMNLYKVFENILMFFKKISLVRKKHQIVKQKNNKSQKPKNQKPHPRPPTPRGGEEEGVEKEAVALVEVVVEVDLVVVV